MQRVNERVSPAYFESSTPRPFPFDALPDLILDHIIRPGLRNLLDPFVAVGLIVLLLGLTHAPWFVITGALLLLGARVAGGALRVFRRVEDEIRLLRHGLALRAHVLRLRPHRDIQGEIDGAKLDCALAVAARRTYVGSVWLSDGAEAVQIAQRGRLLVICLPRTPGTWRVVEDLRSEVRYDRLGPIAHVPTDE
jgi:hypothetical protein